MPHLNLWGNNGKVVSLDPAVADPVKKTAGIVETKHSEHAQGLGRSLPGITSDNGCNIGWEFIQDRTEPAERHVYCMVNMIPPVQAGSINS